MDWLIPPLSGGEVAREAEEKGRGLFERSEFHRPRRQPRRRAQKSDNCGGASWFVLLAAEKNEQRSFNPSPQKQLFLRSLPYILRCKTQGEVARSDGGVKKTGGGEKVGMFF